MKILKIRHSVRLAFFVLALLCFTLEAGAQPSAVDSLIDKQLHDLYGTIPHEAIRFQRWWYGWLAGYSAATAVQGAVCLTTENKTLRQDMALGAATTLLGAAGQLISPMIAYNSPLRGSLDEVKADSLRALSPDQYRELLKALAVREKEGRSWKTHATACAVNLGSGLITWLGYKRTFMDGLENFALNTAVTELQIWTQPVRAVKAYRKYCENEATGTSGDPLKPDSEWNMAVYPGGFTLSLTF